MNRIILILAAITAYVAWQHHQAQERSRLLQDYKRSISSNIDPCTGKKFCAIAYVAPWCPACRANAGNFKQLIKRSAEITDYGFKVVVGQGASDSENIAYAASYEGGAYADEGNKLFLALGVSQFPSFYILDNTSKLVASNQEAMQIINQKFSHQN